MWYERIRNYYVQGLWTKGMVRNAVSKGRITQEQYKSITGEDY